MNVSRSVLLDQLPPYQDQWITIKDNQKVEDIVKRIQVAHKKYAPFYDKISVYFDGDDVGEVCDNVYEFLAEEIKYQEETEDDQTTALPTGILERGVGDCKHYALLAGGILDSLQRITGKKIDWKYRFANYDWWRDNVHHVFVVVTQEDGQEIWIDPTPGANKSTPIQILDKKVKSQPMALRENIAGIDTSNNIGIASLAVTPVVNKDNLNFDGSGTFAGVFNPYLGLSEYRDYGGDRNINEKALAAALNAEISKGPMPGHTVRPDFVKWVYDSNIRSWNFYYPGGVTPYFNPEDLLPEDYPRLILTEDNRLTFDRDMKIDDWRNPYIHLLTAWAQDLINQFDPTPYPVKPAHLKVHSQLKEGNVDTRNLFTEARGDSIFKEIGKAVEDTINFVKEGVLKIVGSIPRNAFLGLVGLNVFGWATGLKEKIAAGKWDSIANTWKGLGGNPSKLQNTIEDGAKKKAILGNVESIGAEPVTASATTAAWLAAAAPVIAVMLKFLDKTGKATQIADAVKDSLQAKFPQLKLEIGSSFDFLDKATGKPIQWTVDPRDDENYGGGNNQLPTVPGSGVMEMLKQNPLPVAAAAGLGTYFFLNKKGRKPNYVIPAVVAGGVFFLLNSNLFGSGSTMNVPAATSKRAYLIDWVNTSGEPSAVELMIPAFQRMSSREIDTVYDWVYNYVRVGKTLVPGTPLQTALVAINDKYHIFES